jgi:hypothetical protein
MTGDRGTKNKPLLVGTSLSISILVIDDNFKPAPTEFLCASAGYANKNKIRVSYHFRFRYQLISGKLLIGRMILEINQNTL